MVDQRDMVQAEELSVRRARALPILAIIFLSQQFAFFNGGGVSQRKVDHVHIAAWLVLSVVILIALATGGGWIYPRRVRDLANDESTQAHRSEAFRLAFLVSMATCVGLYIVSIFEPLSGRDALHLVMTTGIAAALVRFAVLERRAARGD